jgi:hypothetical protein
MIIIIINSILSPLISLSSLLLLYATPTLRPFLLLLFCSSNSPFPLGSCARRERERRRRRGGRQRAHWRRSRRQWSIFCQRRSEVQPVQRVILRRSKGNPDLDLAKARSKSVASAASHAQRQWRNHYCFLRKSKFI